MRANGIDCGASSLGSRNTAAGCTTSGANRPTLRAGEQVPAMRIDATLVTPLEDLPPGTFGGPTLPLNDPRANPRSAT